MEWHHFSTMTRDQLGDRIKKAAYEVGFMFCGISKAEKLEDEAPKLEAWLNKGYHGRMTYMENHFDKRLDPSLLVPGAKSVITVAYNYFPENDINEGKKHKIAKYAFGQDYHHVIKEKLRNLVSQLQSLAGDFHARVFVDSAPVMERQWAQRSGLGWIGKNSLLLNRNAGSFFFLAEIICDLDLPSDGPVKDYCGTCTRCIDACPTDAIVGNTVVDASRCISYLTIELKEDIKDDFSGAYDEWIFGCDICQDVCPWNRFARPHQESKFSVNQRLAAMTDSEWQELTEELFAEIARKSPMKRAKYEGMKRNIRRIGKGRNKSGR